MKFISLVLLIAINLQIQAQPLLNQKNEIRRPLRVLDDYGNIVPVILTDENENPQDFLKHHEDPKNTDFNKSTTYMLFTRKKPDHHEIIYLGDKESLLKSHFDPKKQTRIITHGWISSNISLACTGIRDAYLRRGDYNVIIFDWSTYSTQSYFKSTKYVKPLGIYVAKMLDFLVQNNMDSDVLTIIGHSLGAHIAGLAGFYSKTKIQHVVGLDPALPLFANKPPGSRISVLDAKHVEIIHTNAGYMGIKKPIGHSDFYPNGGTDQIGCGEDVKCSHSRSYIYYAESLNTEQGFYAYKSESYNHFQNQICYGNPVVMGNDRPNFVDGSFYLMTNSEAPYAKGKVHC